MSTSGSSDDDTTAVLCAEPVGDPDAAAASGGDKAAIEMLVAGHGGRTRPADGGTVVAGFSEPAQAVRCAVAIQQRLYPIDAAERVGPAWRVAAGLAEDALAPVLAATVPDEVRISVALHLRVRDRLGLGLGFAPLEEPAEGFRVLADPATAPQRVWLYQAGALHNAALVLVLLLLLAAIAVPLWHLVIAPGGP